MRIWKRRSTELGTTINECMCRYVQHEMKYNNLIKSFYRISVHKCLYSQLYVNFEPGLVEWGIAMAGNIPLKICSFHLPVVGIPMRIAKGN